MYVPLLLSQILVTLTVLSVFRIQTEYNEAPRVVQLTESNIHGIFLTTFLYVKKIRTARPIVTE